MNDKRKVEERGSDEESNADYLRGKEEELKERNAEGENDVNLRCFVMLP